MRPKLKLDELNKALLITAGAAYVLSFVLNRYAAANTLFRLIFAAALIFLGIRLFAGHPEKRNNENMRFLAIVTSVKEFFHKTFGSTNSTRRPASASASGGLLDKWKQQWREYRTYRYLICPQCSQRLRVPRGKGRIRVTCTKCRNQFIAKS